jgi:hypothetical protein
MTQFSTLIENYEFEVDQLPLLHKNKGGGKARFGSGTVYENLAFKTCEYLGFDPKKNDYKRTMIVGGRCLNNLQVDAHVYIQGVLKKLIECKTYLDLCNLERAILNFIGLDQSPDVPDDVEFAIFAGQNACRKDSLAYYLALFKELTGKDLNIFFINPYRKRSSKRPIYNADYRADFKLDEVSYNKFVEWLQK